MNKFDDLECELSSPEEYLELARQWAIEKNVLTTQASLVLAELASAAQNEEAFRLLAEIGSLSAPQPLGVGVTAGKPEGDLE